jgi:hypothetical protein
MTPRLAPGSNLPIDVNVCGQKVRFEDLWRTYEVLR